MCSRLDSYADPCSYLESEALEPSFVDPEESQPDAESTRIEDPEEFQPDAENQYSTDYKESSLHDPTPAETTRSWRTVPKEAKCILFFFQVQDLGLQADYNNDRGTYASIRKVMALPFLPAEPVSAMYARIQTMGSSQKLPAFVTERFQVAKNGSFRRHHICESHDQRLRTLVF